MHKELHASKKYMVMRRALALCRVQLHADMMRMPNLIYQARCVKCNKHSSTTCADKVKSYLCGECVALGEFV